MIYGLYHSAAGMMTNEYRQGVIANNLANAETVGFKPDFATFAERIPAWEAGRRRNPTNRELVGLPGGMWLGQTHTDFTPAPKTQTGNWHDVALDGRGFLVVEVDGQPQFTRDGRLLRTPEGLLVAATDGAPVLDVGGRPLRVNPRGGEPEIDERGGVHQDGALLGRLAVVDFANYDVLRKVDGVRFSAPEGTETLPAPALLRAGYTESSRVEPMRELVQMMEASRAYQMNARMVMMQDESAGRLISLLLRA